MNAIGVCTDDGECVGSPELRLLRKLKGGHHATWRVVVGWRSKRRWNRGLRSGTVTVLRDNERTGNAKTHTASSGPVKHECSRGRTLRVRNCRQSRDVLHGRGRPTSATDPLKDPCRGRTLGRWVNGRPFHATVIQGFEIRRTTNVGTTEGENGRGTWHVVRDTEN